MENFKGPSNERNWPSTATLNSNLLHVTVHHPTKSLADTWYIIGSNDVLSPVYLLLDNHDTNRRQLNNNQNTKIFSHAYFFENDVCKIKPIVLRPQCAKTITINFHEKCMTRTTNFKRVVYSHCLYVIYMIIYVCVYQIPSIEVFDIYQSMHIYQILDIEVNASIRIYLKSYDINCYSYKMVPNCITIYVKSTHL